MDPTMMEYLEKFEDLLEKENLSGQLRMLLFACAEKVWNRRSLKNALKFKFYKL